jgi:opacity protein-like surface antigen
MPKIARRVLASLVIATCVAMIPTAGYAQQHQGSWFGAGGGYSSAHPSCDTCDHGGRETGGVLYVNAGATLTPRLLLGGEFKTWKKDAIEMAPNVMTALRMSSLSATTTFYPSAAGVFIKGGIGVAFLDAEFTVGQTALAPDLGRGLGYTAGAGYDVPLTERVSLTPAVNFWFGRIGDLNFDSDTFLSDWRQNSVDITIGLTFH